jgi:hypothetical protein
VTPSVTLDACQDPADANCEASAPSLFGACLSRFSGYWWTATSINVEMIGTDLVVPQMLD